MRTDRRKILFVIRSLNIGGAERQFIELAGGLRRAGWDVTLATFYGGGSLEPLLASHGVRHVTLEKRGRWDVLPFLYRLLKLIRSERPQIVHSMLTMSNVLTGLLRPLVKPTRIVWGVATSNMDLSYYDWLAKVEVWLEVRLAKHADLIICNSFAGRTYHVELGYPADRTVVVSNGIDTERFRPDAKARREMRAAWNIAEDEKLVGIVGRLDPIKDHRNFLAAAKHVIAARGKVRFACIGDGAPAYRASLVALATDLGIDSHVVWVRESAEIWRMYNALDLLVSSSISEGLANVIVEAMATDVRCVATDVGDSARVVENPRWLAPPSDSRALGAAIVSALADPAEAPGALRQRIEARYGLKRLVAETADRFERIGAEPMALPARSRAPSILFLTRRLDVGGAQRQLVELAIGLHQAGWRVTVATFYSGGALSDHLRGAGVEPVSLDKTARWDLFAFLLRLLRLIRRARPDIVHGYLDTSNVLLTLLRPFCGHARVVWGVRASNMDFTQYDRLAAVESRIARRLARRADLIICNSEAGRAYHAAAGYPPARMIVIPNGVDVRRFAPDADARQALRAEWRIAAGQCVVGLVARLDPMKGHRDFLDAAARLAAARPDVRFVCVGDGPDDYKRELLQHANGLGLDGVLTWVGARNDMPRVYNALDLAVSSSAYGEGFPNTIVEAMATGVPCVVTDVGDSASIVRDLGWVCPPHDSVSLTAAIARAIDALPADARKTREHVTTCYSSAILLERTIAELAPLTAKRAAVAGASIGGYE